jgi:hypothetical protein
MEGLLELSAAEDGMKLARDGHDNMPLPPVKAQIAFVPSHVWCLVHSHRMPDEGCRPVHEALGKQIGQAPGQASVGGSYPSP